MTGIDQETGRPNVQFGFEPRADLGEVIIFDMPNLTHGDRINSDDRDQRFVAFEHQRFGIERVIHGSRIDVGDVDFGDACQ